MLHELKKKKACKSPTYERQIIASSPLCSKRPGHKVGCRYSNGPPLCCLLFFVLRKATSPAGFPWPAWHDPEMPIKRALVEKTEGGAGASHIGNAFNGRD